MCIIGYLILDQRPIYFIVLLTKKPPNRPRSTGQRPRNRHIQQFSLKKAVFVGISKNVAWAHAGQKKTNIFVYFENFIV
jgi:hypothetical protein